ncbi:hypothetical protein BC827DRAFT_1161841 [Russula dissimulans]|nr:hypothetical protein BC827DRAFT_1161841 [Russula dissimulans]
MSLVAMARIESTSTMILMIMSVIAAVGGTSVYDSTLLKKFSMRLKRSTSMSWLASTSFATKRRTPIPVKITFAGENTRPTPSPRLAENVYRTFTVGLSQFRNLSSLL